MSVSASNDPIVVAERQGSLAGVLLRVLLIVALVAIAILFVARLMALFPLQNDVTAENSLGDDWFLYHVNAISVVKDGLSMPNITGPYRRPAGFGYVYFVAAIYAIAGINSEVVYLVQGLLMVAGVAGMVLVFRRELSATASLVLVTAIAILLYADLYRAITFRLLSENLVFPLLPALLLSLMRGEATAKSRYFASAGALSGLLFLIRPNLLLVGPAAALTILLFASSRPLAWRMRAAVTLLVAFTAVATLLPLRNYAATGRPTAPSVTGTSDWSGQRLRSGEDVPLEERMQGRLARTGRRVGYLLGFAQLVRPTFRFRPHWLVLWLGFAAYLTTLVRRRPQFWEALVLALSAAYFVPIVEFGSLTSYGSRMLAPGLPLIALLAIRGVEPLLTRVAPSR